MPGFEEAAGIVAAMLSFATCPIYLLSVVRGQTRPDRVTWWVLAAVSTMIALSYYGSGARETIWLPIEYAASFLVIAIFSIWYGDGPPRLHTLDRVCVIGAVTSGLVWFFVSSPIAALVAATVTEFIGLLPTIVKAYSRPWSEDRFAWTIATLASALNVLALTSYELELSGYPVYVLLTNGVIAALLFKPTDIPSLH